MTPRPLRRYFGSVDLESGEHGAFLRRGLLSVASVGIQGVIRFLYSVVIGRTLGPALLAATNSAISLAQLASLLWPTASGSAATKFIARARGEGDMALSIATAAYLARSTLLASAVLAVLTGAFSLAVTAPADWLTASLVAALTFTLSNYNFVRGVYFSVGLVPRAVVWDSICAIISLGLLALVLFFHWNGLLLAPLALAYGVYSLFGWPRGRTLGLDRARRAEITAFIAWTSIGSLATGGFLQLSMVVAHAVGSASDAGMYAAALTLATPASMLSSVLSLVLFPSMAHASGRGDQVSVRRQADLASRGLLAVLGLVFGVIVLLASPLVSVAFGPGFARAIPLLPILLCASFAMTVNTGAVNALLAGTRRTVRIPSILSAAGVATGLGAMAALVPRYSVYGVAVGYLVGAVIIGFGPIVALWIRERMSWTALWLRFGVGGALATALFVLGRVYGWGVLVDVLSAVAFGAVWLLLFLPEIRMARASKNRDALPSAPVE